MDFDIRQLKAGNRSQRKRGNILKKAGCLALILSCLITALTACYDSKEVDTWAYVYSMGVDKGVGDKLRFTVQIPTLKGQTSSGSGQGASAGQGTASEFTTISIDCPTLYAGVNMINTSLSRTLNFMHTKYIIVSEDFARSGVGPFANSLRRARQIRRIMHFMVVKGEASKFIEQLNPVLGVALSKFQEGMMEQEGQTALFDDSIYGDFIDELKSTKGQPSCLLAGINDYSGFLPEGSESRITDGSTDYYAGEIPRKGGNKFEFLGTALFDGDKMVDELNGEETRVTLMAKNDFSYAYLTIPDPLKPKLFATAEVKSKKRSDVKVSFDGDKPVINVKLFLEGDLVNLQSDVNYESEKLLPVLEEAFESHIKEKLDKTIEKCKNLSCDVFGFGGKASMNFLTIQEWEDYNWNKHFKDAEISTEVEFTMRRTGTVMKTNPTRRAEGQKE